jgi:Ca2+-binding EF-hand superfamily protein
VITRAELLATLTTQLGESDAQARLESVFAEMDSNGDGVVDMKELWNYYRAKSSQIMQQEAENETTT